jgi:hypothetical protein
MSKAGGSLPRGRRTQEQVPSIPATEGLPSLQQQAQRLLGALVEAGGGRWGLSGIKQVEVEHVEIFVELFEEWARRNTDHGSTYFNGRPGLWRAFDELYPLQDPNRWDRLRQAVIEQLEHAHGWQRRRPPNGAGWDLPDSHE